MRSQFPHVQMKHFYQTAPQKGLVLISGHGSIHVVCIGHLICWNLFWQIDMFSSPLPWAVMCVVKNRTAQLILGSGFHQKGKYNNIPLTFYGKFKDTCYVWGKEQQNLLDILACNSANKPSFQNPTRRDYCSKKCLSDYQPKYPEVLYLPHAEHVSLSLTILISSFQR